MPLLKIVAALGVALVVAAAPAHSAETATPNDTARFLAGMPPAANSPLAALVQDPAWQEHAQLLNTVWAGLEEHQLSKVRAWSRANVTTRRPVTYYFFSGPDFLYADAFFPNSPTYILAGLEPIGPPPDVLALRARSIGNDLESLRISISTLLSRSYFITSYMGADLSASQLRGTLPILYVFLARTGKTIHDVSFVSVKQDGSIEPSGEAKDVTHGVKIVFSGPDNKKQTLYYFRTNLANKGVQSSGFLEFCRQLGVGDVFIKAASYLLHTPVFSMVRDFLLAHGATVVQDDTGIPLKYFEQRTWQVRPFGRYVGPIPVFRGNFQSKLKTLFEKAGAPPIDFGIGYRWRTNESHVLLATNPNPLAPAAPASEKALQEKSGQEKSTQEKGASNPPASVPKVREDPAVAANAPQKIIVPERKALPEKRAGPDPPTAAPEKDKPRQSAPPAPAEPAAEASRFVRWPNVLFGGIFSAALVKIFGLEGIASGIGFLLQAAAIGGIAWLGLSYLRAREQQASTVDPALAEQVPATRWSLTRAVERLASDETPTKRWPEGLAERLRRWAR
jgi:hypothetical protein